MKKKILLMVVIVAVLICLFAISASAAVTPNNDGEVYVTSDNKTLALYDTEGNALAWFKDSSAEFGYVAYRVEIDFTCTLTQGGKEIHTNSPMLNDTDNDPNTVFPYSLNNMILLNGRDYESFTQISGSFKGYPLEAVYVNNKFKWINQTTFRESNIRVFDIPTTHTESIHFGNMCFWKAIYLQYIFIPDGATLSGDAQFQHTAIRSLAFGPECKITAIGRYAFYDCKNLTDNVVIPNTVSSIGDYAFAFPGNVENNTNSLSVVLPSNLTSVGDKIFQNNNSLVSIKFTGTSLTAINSPAFENCNRLTGVVLPEGLTTLGNCAFNGCSSLASITFPTTLTTLNGNNHFLGAAALTTVIGLENTALTSISENMFRYNRNWKPEIIRIPNTVTEIKNFGFADVGMTNIYLGAQVTSLGKETFTGCSSLKNVYIPNTLTSINDMAFNGRGVYFFVTSTDASYLETIKTKSGASTIVTYADYSANPDNYKNGKYVISGLNPCETFYGEHIEIISKPATLPTCTETGLTAEISCSRCSKLIKAQEPVNALGHSYNAVVTEPTCTAGGYTTYTCSVCNDEYTGNVTEAAGHKWNGGACTACDATRFASIGNNSYNSFEEAMEAAKDNDQVYIYEKVVIEGNVTWDYSENIVVHFANIEDSYVVVVKGSLTINHLNCDFDDTDFGIGVQPQASLTINGGTFTNSHTYLIGSWGTTLITSGKFYAQYCAVNAFDGKLTIMDGTFSVTDDDATDEYPPSCVFGNGEVNILGGHFNTDVSDYMTPGYVQEKDGLVHICIHTWTATGTACENGCGVTRAAYIGNVNYATFDAAYEAAKAGDKEATSQLKIINTIIDTLNTSSLIPSFLLSGFLNIRRPSD